MINQKQETYTISQNGEKVLSITITSPLEGSYYDIIWDSKTGIVSACTIKGDETTRRAIPYIGNACGTLDPDLPIEHPNMTLSYHYWYY